MQNDKFQLLIKLVEAVMVLADPGLIVQDEVHNAYNLCPTAGCILGFKFAEAAIDDQVEIIVAKEATLGPFVCH